jgi:hypothetical protein
MGKIPGDLASALASISGDAFDRLTAVDSARKVEDRLVEDLWLELRRSAYPNLILQRRGDDEAGDLVARGEFVAEFKLCYRGEHAYAGERSWRGSARHDLDRLRALRVPHRIFVQVISFGPTGQYLVHRSCGCADEDACLAAWAQVFAAEGLTAPIVARRGIMTMLMFEVRT